MNGIVLFDGECNLCDKSVQFIINKDPDAFFLFTSLQSDTGKKLLEQHALKHDNESLIFIKGEKCYDKSSAALRICKHLKGIWKVGYLALIIPKPFRDFIYTIIAKNRYHWFGKSEHCMIPSPEIKKRFI